MTEKQRRKKKKKKKQKKSAKEARVWEDEGGREGCDNCKVTSDTNGRVKATDPLNTELLVSSNRWSLQMF